MPIVENLDLSTRPGSVALAPPIDLPFGSRTVTGVARRAAALWPDDPFVRIDDLRVTFKEAIDRSLVVAGALRSISCASQDVVAIFLPSCMEVVDFFLAASHLGAVTFPINTSYQGYLLKYGLNDSGSKIVVTDLSLAHNVIGISDQLPNLEQIVVLGATEADLEALDHKESSARLRSYDVIATASAPVGFDELPPVGPYDVNSIIYTSGTTGPSKGVMMSNAHTINKALSIIDICRMSKSDIIYAPIPLFHTFGLHRGVLSALVLGLEVVLRKRFSAGGYWTDVVSTGATIGFVTASIVQILKSADSGTGNVDNSLRCMFSAPYDSEFEERFGLRLLQTFSMTEANNALFSPYDDPPVHGACGKVSDGWQIKLVDDDGDEVPVGKAGEICLRPLRPGNVMLGYHNQPAATQNAFRDLWLHTGDLGRRDEDDNFYFVDRKKDSIRRRGENISSWEVEKILAGHPAVAECAALAFPSPVGEDDVWTIVTLQPGYEGSESLLLDIAAFCAREMPDFMVPRYIEVRDELPKTPTEKILKAQLRDAGLGPKHLDRGDRGRQRADNTASHAG